MIGNWSVEKEICRTPAEAAWIMPASFQTIVEGARRENGTLAACSMHHAMAVSRPFQTGGTRELSTEDHSADLNPTSEGHLAISSLRDSVGFTLDITQNSGCPKRLPFSYSARILRNRSNTPSTSALVK